MGVSFSYKPVSPTTSVSFESGSALNKAFESAYGAFPFVLSEANVERLKGFVDCGHVGVETLIDAIREFGEVEVQSHW